jgi:hypothetical protein
VNAAAVARAPLDLTPLDWVVRLAKWWEVWAIGIGPGGESCGQYNDIDAMLFLIFPLRSNLSFSFTAPAVLHLLSDGVLNGQFREGDRQTAVPAIMRMSGRTRRPHRPLADDAVVRKTSDESARDFILILIKSFSHCRLFPLIHETNPGMSD